MTLLSAELNQEALRGSQRLPAREVTRTLRAVAKGLGLKRSAHISVAFVSATEIRRLNARYRGKDKVTDVLSFQLTPPSKTAPGEPFGEVLLCYAQAKKQAAQMNHSVRQELLFLLVHGVLHLFGHDHEEPTEARRMFTLQSRILQSLGIDDRL